MKVLHLLSQTELTGSEVHAHLLVQKQVLDGHQVFVISDRLHLSFSCPSLSLSIATASFTERLRNIFTLREFIKEHQIEVVHAHSRAACRHEFWALLGTKTALVTTLHGRQHFSLSKRLFNIYGKFLIAICENLRTALVQDFRMEKKQIRILRNPFDLSAFEYRSENRPITRLGLISRSSGPKGARLQAIILHCAETWLRKFPHLQIEVITTDIEKLNPLTIEFVRSLSEVFSGRIQIIGNEGLKSEKYHELDIVVGAGRVALEALLSGCAVFALGEAEYQGLVDLETLDSAMASNFGDIHYKNTLAEFDPSHLYNDVAKFVLDSSQWEKHRSLLAEKIRAEYDLEEVHREVLAIYKAAIASFYLPQWIPTLMYHRVPKQTINSQHKIYISKERFIRHLDFFKERKFTTLWFSDLAAFWDQQRPWKDFPKKPLILTFDDGYQDNLENAFPELKIRGLKANLYLLANTSIRENSWDKSTGEEPAKLLSAEQRQTIPPEVIEIGSHGYDHIHLTEASALQAEQQMLASKQSLEKEFGRPIFSFAYPFGSTSEALAKICRRCGYRFAVATDTGSLRLQENPHLLFRVNIFPEDELWALRKKTSSWYYRYFYFKRKDAKSGM
jgi:peptidoglycan/xylan/chitin deacetylase (PgdA/CDA1 family)